MSKSKLTSKPKKLIYILIGTISLVIGIIGIIVPVLPTTPFILLSAGCYYRGSSRFHDWLLNHNYFGPIILEYSDGKGIRRNSKIKAIILTWIMVLVTALFILDSLSMRLFIISLAIIGTIVILRLKTRYD
jgi:uncharacterized membrane protein YbaN (DUF454 family)